MVNLLPDDFTISHAAAMRGEARRTFRNRAIRTGLVAVNERGRVPRVAFEAYDGRPVTPERLLQAERRLDATDRERQRNYRQSHSEAARVHS